MDLYQLINGGVRLLSRSDDKVNPCGFRLTQEGLPSLFPYLNADKVVEIDTNDATKLLLSENVTLDQFNDKYKERLLELNSGCCVLVIKRDAEDNSGLPLTLPICCWKGKNSMRAYIAKNERIHFLRLCGADVTETGLTSIYKSILITNIINFLNQRREEVLNGKNIKSKIRTIMKKRMTQRNH